MRLSSLLGLMVSVALLALVACGPSEEATPTPTAAARATPTATVAPLTVREIPTVAPTTGGIISVKAQASDFQPKPDLATMASTQVLRLRVTEDIQPAQMDPARQTSPTPQMVTAHTSSRLLRMKLGTTELVPDLATGWEIADQGKTITFTLRQGVQWQQGYGELTAQDVVTHYKRMAGEFAEYQTLWKGNFAQVESMEAVDKYTVRFKFKTPDAAFFRSVLMHRPGPITKLEAIKELGDKYQNIVPGVGAFKMSTWEKGVKLEIVKSPTYFNTGLPYLDKVEILVIRDDTVAELALKAGQLDFAAVSNNEVITRFLASSGNLKVGAASGTGIHIIYVNWTKPPLDNLKVRQALYYAVDWDKWLQFGLDGRGIKAFSPVAVGALYYDQKCVKSYDYNVELAKKLLAEAGFPGGQGSRTMTYITTTSAPFPALADFVAQYWKAIGVTIDAKPLEGALYQERRNKGDYDLITVSGGSHIWEPSYQMVRYYHSANIPPGNNNSYYTRADEAIDRLVTSFDPADRAKAMCDFLRQASEDVATMSIPYPHRYTVTSSKVQYMQEFDENVGFGNYFQETWISK